MCHTCDRVHRADSTVVRFENAGLRLAGGRHIVSDLNFEIRGSEILILLGRSGSGKTTTLKLINGLLLPTDGQVTVEGTPTHEWNPARLRRHIGYVIQEIGLFPHMTVERNVGIVPRLEGWDDWRRRDRARELLELVGLDPSTFAGRYPAELSGGQMQRVAIARALANDPPILLADEPTGNLDPYTGEQILDLLTALNNQGKTIIMVTHESHIAAYAQQRLHMKDGQVEKVEEN